MTTYTVVASEFLAKVDAPVTPNMLAAVRAWTVMENGPEGRAITGNNPWNLHVGPACPIGAGSIVVDRVTYHPAQWLSDKPLGAVGNRYAGSGDQNVAIFPTLSDGVGACVVNLEWYADRGQAGYAAVLTAAQRGDALGFLAALARSSWSAGHYGSPDGNPLNNKLVSIYRALGGSMTEDDPDMIDFLRIVPKDRVRVTPGKLFSDPACTVSADDDFAGSDGVPTYGTVGSAVALRVLWGTTADSARLVYVPAARATDVILRTRVSVDIDLVTNKATVR